MATDHRAVLKEIRTFPSLVRYLRDEMGWPIEVNDFEELTFEYTPEELGIDPVSAAKIQEIKRLRPLSVNQPWGIFFIKFEPKKLPVVALRRILGRVVLKQRASANSAERAAWEADDLLFVSNFGEGDERQITFAHFSQDERKDDLPTLKVLGWNNLNTLLHLDDVAELLTKHLAWPENEDDVARWRENWRSAFTLRHREVITTSKALAVRLAHLARDIRNRINAVLAIETEDGAVTKLMNAFQQSLVHDLNADGFADMYAQTIAYGLLSARVANPKASTADDFAAQLPVTNPFLKEMMETFLHVGGRRGKAGSGTGLDFDELGVSEVVELLDDANMEAVVRDFGDRNPQEDPVIHFYELFLEEYDAKKRIQRGVFYTPRPVVSYIVRSVHELLETEFGLADGLADTATWGEMAKRHKGLTIPDGVKPTDRFVTVLEPATGTGTFLVDVIDIIHTTMTEKWKAGGHASEKIAQLWNDFVPKHILPRLYGYELLMAPYAIAHLKIGLKLHETGYSFKSDERARIYLTNSLEPAQAMQVTLSVPALAHEAQAVNAVKRHQRFTVVVGNPPYAGISSNMSAHAQNLVDAYKVVDGKPLNERKLWLQDDYVKFIRKAQITLEEAGTGILGFITNHGYLDNPTFRGMRQSLAGTFQGIRVVNLHGNALKKETTPEGSKDENVFDIRQGVAICLATRRSLASSMVLHYNVWGSRAAKYGWLASCSGTGDYFVRALPASPYYFFQASDSVGGREYDGWATLAETLPTYTSGVITARDHIVLDFDREPILQRVAQLRDPKLSDHQLRKDLFDGKGSPKYQPGDSRGWKLSEARRRLMDDRRWRERVSRCAYRPFDDRALYLTEWMVDWPRLDLLHHLSAPDNMLLVFPRNTGAGLPWDHVFVSRHPILGRFFPDSACITYMAPLVLRQGPAAGASEAVRPNFSGQDEPTARGGSRIRDQALDKLGYIYAILHSPTYRDRYRDQLRRDFPRLPLASKPALLRPLARLGRELVALHLVEAPVQQALSARYDKAAEAWRYEVAKGQRLPVTLSFNGPGKPVVGKVWWSDDTVWIDAVKSHKGPGDAPWTGSVGFQGVLEEVWNFHIGGYQVCEKWLKDRKDRTLTADDITHYHRIVIALHETIRIMREIDEVIDAHGGWPGAFQGETAATDDDPRRLQNGFEPRPLDEYGTGRAKEKR